MRGIARARSSLDWLSRGMGSSLPRATTTRRSILSLQSTCELDPLTRAIRRSSSPPPARWCSPSPCARCSSPPAARGPRQPPAAVRPSQYRSIRTAPRPSRRCSRSPTACEPTASRASPTRPPGTSKPSSPRAPLTRRRSYAPCQRARTCSRSAQPKRPRHSPGRRRRVQLAFARCIRSHGFPSFPDPTTNGQLTHEMVAAAGINLHQPAVLQAGDACVARHARLHHQGDRRAVRRRALNRGVLRRLRRSRTARRAHAPARCSLSIALATPTRTPSRCEQMGERVVDSCRRQERLLEALLTLAQGEYGGAATRARRPRRDRRRRPARP